MNNEHDMNWENVDVLHKDYDWKKRLFSEMVYIEKQWNNALNNMICKIIQCVMM